MTVCIHRYKHTTALCYWPNTTGMTHLKTYCMVSSVWRIMCFKHQPLLYMPIFQSRSVKILTQFVIKICVFCLPWSTTACLLRTSNDSVEPVMASTHWTHLLKFLMSVKLYWRTQVFFWVTCYSSKLFHPKLIRALGKTLVLPKETLRTSLSDKYFRNV